MADDLFSGDGENVSGRLPKTDADADLLKPAIAELLRTIPETWVEFESDALSGVKSNALFLLTAAGLVERRGCIRATIANHPTFFEFRFQATGEGGFSYVMEKVSALQYATWRDAWRAWSASETRDCSPFHADGMKPDEWRLTDQGVLARGELGGTNDKPDPDVFNFVLKRGLFGPGYCHRIPAARPLSAEELRTVADHLAASHDLSRLPRPAVCGSGQLVEFRKIEQPAGAQGVNPTNWNEGADAFASAVAKWAGPAFEALTKAQQTNDADGKPKADDVALQSQESPPAGDAEPKPRLVVMTHPPQATVDGTAYAITPDATTFLTALLRANGDWVGPSTHGVRTNRVIRGLPPEIRKLIEAAGAKGARIRLV